MLFIGKALFNWILTLPWRGPLSYRNQSIDANQWTGFYMITASGMRELSSGFNLTTRDSYFTNGVGVFTNHILAENTYFTNKREWTDHKIMVLKPENKYQIIRQRHISRNILITDFQHHLFLCWAKVVNIKFFTDPQITNYKDETIIYYFIYSGARKVFRIIMQQNYVAYIT